MIAERQQTAEETVAEYVESVLNGEIAAGELVKHSVNRYVADLERQETEGFPFWLDRKTAETVCRFFPRYLRHSTGGTAGQRFELTGFQAFIVWNLFGWKRTADGTRRFRKAFVSVARKNGKSTLAAGIALYMARSDINPHTETPEQRSQVILAATQREQAEIIYAEILKMLEVSPELTLNMTERKANPQRITFNDNGGTIRTIGSDRPKDGMNPHLVVLDELHAFTKSHQKTYDTLQTGSGFRDQPLILTVTTAGDDHSYIWADERQYAASVAQGSVSDDALFAMCFEIDADDNPLDPNVWIKANPNLDTCLKREYLEDRAKEAKESPLKLNTFTRYHTNRQVNSTATAFDLKTWDSSKGELSSWYEADAIGAGVDLGSRDDFAALALCARFHTGDEMEDGTPLWRYELRTWQYLAADTKRDTSEEPFFSWIAGGLLRVSKFPLRDLTAQLFEQCRTYIVEDVAYDPYNGQMLAEAAEAEGIEIASMAQTQRHFNEPIRELQQALIDGRVRHNGDPLLRWCVSNAVLVSDHQDRVMFTKKDSHDKIDGIVAATMALRRVMVATPRATGSYFVS